MTDTRELDRIDAPVGPAARAEEPLDHRILTELQEPDPRIMERALEIDLPSGGRLVQDIFHADVAAVGRMRHRGEDAPREALVPAVRADVVPERQHDLPREIGRDAETDQPPEPLRWWRGDARRYSLVQVSPDSQCGIFSGQPLPVCTQVPAPLH